MVGASTIQDRLHSAFMSFHTVRPVDFTIPEDQAKFQNVKDILTSQEGPDGKLAATLAQLTDEDGEKAAAMILELYNSLVRRT